MVAADLDVTVDLARSLLAEQHPDLADRRLRLVANGWDNVMLRLGDDLALRLPRRELGAQLMRNEHRVLPLLAPRLPVAVPDPVRTGEPSAALGYPWPWGVVRWADGVAAATVPADRRTPWAEHLARVLVALHRPAPADAPENTFRGVPVAERSASLEERIPLLPERYHARARELWAEAVAAPAYDGVPVWLHGDPHPANLVADGDRLSAVIDFGDVTSGDPASDLGMAWLTFDAEGRERFRAVIDAEARDGRGWDAGTWRRAQGWAVLFTSICFAYPDTHPVMVGVGEHAVEQLFG
ncbi:aminoglycoside phosphotransferase family protein [Promicromonospora sukumoe]|uniref:aminoglycoside phosphotransferase family protein n=1 Tax=Promicromonospora sukumoe TaxID=88382 RepID=UPI00036875EA|nr:aminoglycoside phosphotransferase family protein [Promicromonospora sukumoe]